MAIEQNHASGGRQTVDRTEESLPGGVTGMPGPFVRALAWTAIAWERLWPLLVPLFLIACAFLCLSWLGIWNAAPDWLRLSAVGLFGLAALAALLPLRQWRMPRRYEVLSRIEKATGLAHKPVTAQVDRVATRDDPFAEALWREHRRRMAEQLGDLSSGMARPDGNRFDRFALRAMLPIAAFAALGFSYGVHGGRITDAFAPRIDRAAILSRLDVWITPPAYAGKPPLYLDTRTLAGLADEAAAPVPSISTLMGSALAIRQVRSDRDRNALAVRLLEGEGGKAVSLQAAPGDSEGAVSFETRLERSVTLEIASGDTPIARWQIAVTADRPPVIDLDEPPAAALSGALELNYSVADDYGVVSARALVSQPEAVRRPDARPLVEAPELPLPLPRARAKSGSTKVNRDLSSHPWAGSEVEIVLEATDDPGQVGRSAPVRVTLPGRSVTDGLARALVEQRRILASDANDAPLVASMLDAVLARPDAFDIPKGAYLALRTAYRMVADVRSDDRLREAMDILWETALALELGDLSEVERRLREAQEKLSKALENDAGDEEVEKLMEELRQAMRDFLEQLEREMAQNPIDGNPLTNFDNMQMLSERDLERMMQRIEDLARSGSKDAARELLSEMQRMMDNLMAGRHQQQRRAEGNELNQALDKLSELMQRQQELMEETFSMQRRQPRNMPQGQNQQGQNQQGQNQQGEREQGEQQGQNRQGDEQEGSEGEMTPDEFAEALEALRRQQEELRQQLGELGQQLEDLGLDPSEQFGEAGDEMGQAGDRLAQGDAGSAAGDQGQALDALRRGAQSMMEQMAGDRSQGGQQQGQAGNSGQDPSRTDPLGRRNDARGRIDDGDTRIPGEIDAQKAREIMEAIRRRLADPLRPLIERDYLERLLQSR
ncbi:MAG: TIGR02302 family protein [Nitratireductor sp.]|nr:TIGR02302 family protein [Nitratireductor sp.]